MDKYEYKVRADEIKELIDQGEYIQAAEIADAIDWRRVKSVMMLCTISDLYKYNRRYEDAKNMLLLAYERRPGGKAICYALCELCIKMEEFVQAIEYYKEFVQVAPKDSGRYILQYKLYEAQDVSLEERISVLEELKKREFREKWWYELAYLYHRVGLATRCVEECDELILTFGDGKYVIKAMELKMLHQPLTTKQQEKYDHRFDEYTTPDQEMLPEEPAYDEAQMYEAGQKPVSGPQPLENGLVQGDTLVYENIRRAQQPSVQPVEAVLPPEELDIQVKTMDMGQYNTLNLQAELAAGLREVLGDERSKSAAITRSIVAPMMETGSLNYPELTEEDVSKDDIGSVAEEIESTEVFFGETGEISSYQTGSLLAGSMTFSPQPPEVVPELSEEYPIQEIVPEFSEEYPIKEVVPELSEEYPIKEVAPEFSKESPKKEVAPELSKMSRTEDIVMPRLSEDSSAKKAASASERNEETAETAVQEEASAAVVTDETAETVMHQLKMESIGKAVEQAMIAQPPRELAGVLSQESDGQISLVVPEREVVEKQITGQVSIADVLSEWEQMKKETEERRKEEVRQRVLVQTGPMFTEFEASVRDGLLEQLESGQVEGAPAEEQASTDQDDADDISIEETQDMEDELAQETEDFANGDAEAELAENDAKELPEEAYPEDAGEEVPEEDGKFGEDAYGQEYQPIMPEETEAFNEPVEETAEAEEMEQAEEVEALEDYESEAAVTTGQTRMDKKGSADKTVKEQDEQDSEMWEQARVRTLTREEKELFAPYIQSKAAREQLVTALDNISMASYTGNVIITGSDGMDTSTLAKNIIRQVQMTDSNFAGKVAKISGQALNKKDVAATLQQFESGALMIQKASGMNDQTADTLYRELQGESFGIIVVMEDTKKAMGKLLERHQELAESFTARVNVEAMSNDMLVSFGRQYAKEKEYAIDDLGVLALHTRIEELQTIDHAVTVLEVKEIVDEAIRHANRKTLGHFIDVLLAKRYDEEDMIIVTEKDFA